MSNLYSGCGCGGCGCNSCAPSNTVFRALCDDPGSVNFGTYLSVLDPQFCRNRLIQGTGVLQSILDGSGNPQITFTNAPVVDLNDNQAVVGVTFGDLVTIGSDNILTRLLGPAVANQILITNALGQLIFSPIPAATVPDPLTVGTLTVTGTATLNNVAIGGAVSATAIPSGTATVFLGLDGSNNVVQQTVSSSTAQIAQFFESPTSPNASYPNQFKPPGSNLTIGNLLYDSGGGIITVTDSVTLTVARAGAYEIKWGGFQKRSGNANWNAGFQLQINGITVSNGGMPPTQQLTGQNGITFSCSFMRSLSVGDTIRLLLVGTGTPEIFEVWLNAVRYSS